MADESEKSIRAGETPMEKIAKKTPDHCSSSSSVSEHEKHVQKVFGDELSADLFHSQLGIDPFGHINFVDRGYDLCYQGDDTQAQPHLAQPQLDVIIENFEKGAAMALVQAGNAYMCSARTKKEEIPDHTAYERVKKGYEMAERMYNQALKINPDLYVGLRNLAQQQFEMAKLKWFFALQQDTNFLDQDLLADIFKLFDKAKEYMNDAATKTPTSLEGAVQAKVHQA